MCIIVHKTKKADIPSKETLENCFSVNPDGAGFMYQEHGKVKIKKGYMTFKDFYKALTSVKRKHNDFKNQDLVLHFRIGTQGKNDQATTHPFPITDNESLLRARKVTCDSALVHNGCLSKYTYDNILSDTQLFVRDFMTPLQELSKDYDKPIMKKIIDNAIDGTKIVIMTNDNVYRFGEFVEENGVYYSNATYKTKYYTSSCNVSYYNDYNDWYNYDDGYYSTYGQSQTYDTKALPYNEKRYQEILHDKNYKAITDENTIICTSGYEFNALDYISDNVLYYINDKYYVYEMDFNNKTASFVGIASDMYNDLTGATITYEDLKDYTE